MNTAEIRKATTASEVSAPQAQPGAVAPTSPSPQALDDALAHLIGDSSTEIAHELRNPLFAIEGFATLLERKLGSESPEHRHAQRIVDAARAASRAVDAVSELGRSTPLSLCRVPLVEIVADARRLLESEANVSTEWSINLDTDAELEVDSISAKEAILDLLRNAVESGAENLEISAAHDRAAGRWGIRISDDGEGISPNALSRVRRLFFTTRVGAEGLGLTRVQRAALLHGGHLDLENRAGGGTTACLWLPART